MAFKVFLFTIFLIFSSFSLIQGQEVVELDEENWSQILKGEWMVEFYAPWCPACKALEPRWKEFGRLGPALGLKIGAVDVTGSPGLSGRFMVTALPTIFHVNDGLFRQYKGARDIDAFSLFVEDRKWEQVEAISNWKAPNSIQMSIVASFFKLSQTLRNIHNTFTNEYKLPPMVSYFIFALATIILGACLGLILVCAIDLLFPQKSKPRSENGSGDKKDSDESELNDEDIKDDLIDQAVESENDHLSSETEESQNKAEKARKRKTTKKLDM